MTYCNDGKYQILTRLQCQADAKKNRDESMAMAQQ
jgi:hypothetical protein